MPTHDPTILPAGLPIPIDDGAARHLTGAALPRMPLRATSGAWVNLGGFKKPTVLFFYPRTGVPGQAPSRGHQGEEWDSIPGARGCTPQSCAFRDLHAEFLALGVDVMGVSTSTTEHQREFKARMDIPYEMLSDSELAMVRAMRLPTFEFPVESGGPGTLIRRMAWFISPPSGPSGAPRVAHVWYPVFPPDRNAQEVLAWVKASRGSGGVATKVSPRLDGAVSGTSWRVPVTVRAATPSDLEFVRSELQRHWHSTVIRSRDVPYQADELPALVATLGGEPAGLLTYALLPGELEIVTVSSVREDSGVGSALMREAERIARASGLKRVFLTTSNDNLRALRFYQRRGYRLVSVLRGMMDRYRQSQPSIPEIGLNGIPLRDEIELEMRIGGE